MRKALPALLLLCACAHHRPIPTVDPSYRIRPTESETTFIVEVPRGKSISDFLKEIGCGENYTCAIGADAIYVVQRKPKG